ncbi:uncharacterized protein LOC144469078 [Augochlora pura]
MTPDRYLCRLKSSIPNERCPEPKNLRTLSKRRQREPGGARYQDPHFISQHKTVLGPESISAFLPQCDVPRGWKGEETTTKRIEGWAALLPPRRALGNRIAEDRWLRDG